MAIITHKTLGSIECVRSIRTRSIRLVVRADGTLRLSYPILISQKRAIAFAEERTEWIAKSRERMTERRATVVRISRSEVERLRKAAKQELPQLVERLATEYGFGDGVFQQTLDGAAHGAGSILRVIAFVHQHADDLW